MATAAKLSRDDERKLAHDQTGKSAFDAIKEMVDDLSMSRNMGDGQATEANENRIQEDPLSVQVRDGWRSPGSEMRSEDGPEEYEILLSTGGPATRIQGKLNEHGEPTSARLEVQDWFVPWQEWRGEGWDENVLLDYARCFYFGD